MEEIVENQLFEHNLGVSVRAQPVRPMTQTGQTGPQQRRTSKP